MGSRIHGITVALITRTAEKDAYNYPIWTETREEVENVLIGEPLQNETDTSADTKEARLGYTLAIPKGDTHNWQDAIVEFWGKRFRQYGQVTQGIEEMIPLEWNKKITVEEVL